MNRHLQAIPVAALDLFKATTGVGKWLRLSDEPLAESTIPDDYFGINIATADDPAIDDYLVERLLELGIKQVRMDFSYDSIGGPAQRLLERMLEQGLQVMLEIFPPLADAKILFGDSAAQGRWRDFLRTVFDSYRGRVEWFEVGSTPNRGRWSGFTFLSYQAAWTIAVEQAAVEQAAVEQAAVEQAAADQSEPGGAGKTAIILAGPNISDFEPFYNASFLASMRRSGGSPQIHSDNLFVERVIEPEAYDHRVLGQFATNWLRLNFLKKARILQLIGRDNGCVDTVCTYKCWTSKRLARRSAWPEQKRVDYLVRYLALAASSGALRRVYWGPLICSRDGLISDGAEGYPVIDQVSYYQRVRGQLRDFHVTAGFHALAHCVARFSGASCSSIAHRPNGLSLFQFSKKNGDSFMLCWCRDRMNWSLGRIFQAADLERARFFDACGTEISRPATINEQPLFIEFADGQGHPDLDHIDGDAAPGIIHLSSPHHRSIADCEDTWLGAGMLRADRQLQDLETIPLLRPAALPQLAETAVLREARNRIWNVRDPRGICEHISVKLNRVVGIKRLTYRFRPSKGQRHWNNACEMLRRGIKTPLPIAFYEQTVNPGIRDSWYLCEFVPAAFSAREVYAAFREGATEFRGLDKAAWFACLARFTCEMHNKQIVHRDLSAGNLLLRMREDGTPEPHLIDIGRAWLGNGSGLKQRHRLLDLMRICYKLDWPDREAFIAHYESHLGRSFSPIWRLPFHYYDNKQKFKKTIKGKRKNRSNN